MRKQLALLLAVFIIIGMYPAAVPAAATTLNLSANNATVGEQVTVSGEAYANTWVSIKVLGAGGSVPFFGGVKTSAGGNYTGSFKVPATVTPGDTLKVVAGCGINVATAVLAVNGAPGALSIITQPISRTAAAGQTVTFTVAASGDAPLSYQWKKDGSNIFDGGNISGATTATLTVGNVQAADAGSYACRVSNATGNVTSDAATLTVGLSAAISPATRSFDLDGPADVTTLITWNDAASVSDVVYGSEHLSEGTDYAVDANILSIKEAYLSGLNLAEGDSVCFEILFDVGDSAVFTVEAVRNYTPGSDASLSGLKVGGATVTDFVYNRYEYTVQLPYGTQPGSAAAVSATPNDSKACVAITQAAALPGSATVEVTAEDGLTKQIYTVNLTMAAPTYAIAPLGDQTMAALTAGYARGSQETRTITVTRTGTGDLTNLAAAPGGTNPDHFIITQPLVTTLNAGTPSTTFTVQAKDGLAAGIYTATVTVSADNMTPVAFTVTQAVNSSAGDGSSSGGGSGSTAPKNYAGKFIEADTGGSVHFGNAIVEVPAGTLPADATLQVEQLTDEEAEDIVPSGLQVSLGSDIYEITTTGERNFGDNTLTVRIAYDPAKIAAGEQPVIRYRDETTGQWVDLPTTVEQGADGKWYSVTQVNHLTKFAVFSTPAPEQETVKKVVVLTLGRQAATVDGNPYTLDGVPFATGGRTMVPIRFVSEALGANVDWNATTRQVTIKDGDKEIVLTLGSASALVDGQATVIDAAPQVAGNRTFVPLRFVGETLGAVVDYDPATKQITITR